MLVPLYLEMGDWGTGNLKFSDRVITSIGKALVDL